MYALWAILLFEFLINVLLSDYVKRHLLISGNILKKKKKKCPKKFNYIYIFNACISMNHEKSFIKDGVAILFLSTTLLDDKKL